MKEIGGMGYRRVRSVSMNASMGYEILAVKTSALLER